VGKRRRGEMGEGKVWEESGKRTGAWRGGKWECMKIAPKR